MKLRFIFAWFDFWVGLYYDRAKNRLYFFPVPMFGFVVEPPYRRYFLIDMFGEIIGSTTASELEHCLERDRCFADRAHWCYAGTTTPISKKQRQRAFRAGLLD